MCGVGVGSSFTVLQDPLPSTQRQDPREVAPSNPAPDSDVSRNVISTEASPDQGRKSFAPGVVIDWNRKAVEVEARIVLREGPLELLMCAAGSKEHESILATPARPRDIFQAMGLLGLEPGKPVRWNASGDKLLPPSGQRLALSVQCRVDSKEVVFPIEKWLLSADQKTPPPPIHWVFTGSQTVPENRFGADVEGTIVCLVDFETALISVAALHSADDEQLWLRANPETIPERGTSCRLVIESQVTALTPEHQRKDE